MAKVDAAVVETVTNPVVEISTTATKDIPVSPIVAIPSSKEKIPEGATTILLSSASYEEESGARDTFAGVLTLCIVCITLYVSYNLWKRRRRRRGNLRISKLENQNYRYSRLNQSEIVDVDNSPHNNSLSHHHPRDEFVHETDFAEEQCFDTTTCDPSPQPATLHVEVDTTTSEKSPPLLLQDLSDEVDTDTNSLNGVYTFNTSVQQDLLQ